MPVYLLKNIQYKKQNKKQSEGEMRIIKTLTAIGLILATGYIFGLTILALQLATERAYCRTQPLDQMSGTDYRYCVQLNKELR